MFSIYTFVHFYFESRNKNSNSKPRLYKKNFMLKLLEIKTNNQKWTQEQIAKELGFSDSTIKHCRDDLNKNSLSNRNNIKKLHAI